jgi:uncharacterized membrane protein YjjP (DUF1212 family)
MAKAFGVRVEMTILPRSVMMTVWDSSHEKSMAINEKLPTTPLNFHLISLFSQLSWNVRDIHIIVDDAQVELENILSQPRLNASLVTLLTGLGNASFCRLFGGDWVAMFLVFLATINGFALKNILHQRWSWDIRLATLVAACTSSVIASAAFVFGVTDTPDIALGTSVLYLIPGIPYINSVSDLISGHFLCSLSRFIHACILTACLGIGLALGILIMNIQYF